MKHSHNHIPLLILAIAVTAMAGSLYAYMFYATTASWRELTRLATSWLWKKPTNRRKSHSCLWLLPRQLIERG